MEVRQNFCGSVEPAANFIFACPCKAISDGLEATESCHTIHTPGAVEVLALTTLLWYSKSKLSGHLFGAQFWGP